MIRRLQVLCRVQGALRNFTDEDGKIEAFQMEIKPNDYNQNSLALGGFYNAVATDQIDIYSPIAGWKVWFGVQVNDYDAVEELGRRCPWRAPTVPGAPTLPKAMEDLLVEDRNWAVLVQYVATLEYDRSAGKTKFGTPGALRNTTTCLPTSDRHNYDRGSCMVGSALFHRHGSSE